MQIQISSRLFAAALSTASKVINSKNSMPILDNVLLHAQDGKYYLTGSNNENELSVRIDLTIHSGEFTPLCLPVKQILPALATLGDQPLTITFTDNHDSFQTEVRYLQGAFNVVSLPAEEFPRLVLPADPTADLTIKTSHLLPAIQAAQQNTANDELRPVMNAVVLDITNSDPQHNPMPEQMVIVGSDGRILYKYVIPVGTEADLQFAIPQVSKLLLSKTVISALVNAMRAADTLRVYADDKTIVFVSDDAQLITRSVEGKYPNYNSVIPTQHNYDIVLPVKELTATVKRVALFAPDASQMIALRVESNTQHPTSNTQHPTPNTQISLTATDIDFSLSSKEALAPVSITAPSEFAVGMKSTALLQHLGCITTDNVRLELSDPTRAIIIREDNPNSTLTLLLMPMLLNQ